MIINEHIEDYINSLEGDLPEELAKLEKWALENKVPIIRKSMQSLLIFLLEERKPRNILEIGTAVGFSTLFIEHFSPKGAKITTMEKVEMRLKEARKNLKDHPENLKKEINLYGDITKYFGQTGIKEVSYAILDGKDIGTDPGEGGGEEKADQPKGTGTKDNPFNVAAAVAKCKEVGTTATSEEFYVQGVVAADASVTDASYKNITFEMVDEGFTQIFTAFRVLGPDGKKLKLNYTIPKGAKVVVCGKLVNYNDKTPEIQQTKDYNGTLISVNGQAPELDDGQGGGNDPQPVVGDNLLINGDFETWTQSEYPDNWKTETTAGNATLSKSSNAHGGLASVQMASNTSNKRLGYKEMTLKAGTYTMTFYAKSADADKTCSVACGYASIDAENKLTYVYKTGSDSKTEYTTATNSDWTQITNTFTLSADTKLSIIVMNKGGLGSLLVDDFTLATNDGGIVDGAGESGGGGESTPTINKGTEANPLTVAGAFALIDSQGSSTTKDCYVKGIISKVDNYNSTYKSITYWISEDGNTTGNQLQVYSGKGLNGADFASKDDLTTGKTVVIKGNLKKYNTTYEFDKTSSIISIK